MMSGIDKMRVLNFEDFILNESESGGYEIPDVKSIMGDGYELTAEDYIGQKSTPPMGKILVVDDSNNSLTLSFRDRSGKMDRKLMLGKDSIKFSKNSDGHYIIRIDPNLRWLNTGSNRENIEDFIEDLINSKLDSENYEIRFIDGIRDDIYFIMDILGIPCEVSDIRGMEDNKYVITLDNGMMIDVKKRSSDDLVGNFDIYKKNSDTYPSVTIRSDLGKMIFNFDQENTDGNEEVESDITDVSKNDYLNFLLKKSLGLATTGDEERLYNHFLKVVDSRDWEYSEIDEEEKKERGRKTQKYIKKLKKHVLSFLPENRIREIYPDKN
jgi:hypothetical protein